MGFFGDLFSNDAAKDAATAKTAGLRAGFGEASKYLDEGKTAATGYLQGGAERFDPFLERAYKGYDAYGDAVGLGGQEGMDRARATFTSNPGYREGIESGVDILDRRAASRGMLASGNNEQDTQKFATDYANKGYGDHVARLSPYLTQPMQALTAQGGFDTALANLESTTGQQKANYGWQAETGIGDANASAELARQAAAKNTFDAITGGLSLAGKFMGVGGFAPSPITMKA